MRDAGARNNGTSAIERGVYELPFRSESGDVPLVAVDRRGRCLARRECSNADVGQTSRELWDVLDEEDPMPVLRVLE